MCQTNNKKKLLLSITVLNFVSLQCEIANQLDRLGKILCDIYRRLLPLATIAGMVLLSLPASHDYCRFLFSFGLFEKRQRKCQEKLAKILVWTYSTIYNIQFSCLSILVSEVLYNKWRNTRLLPRFATVHWSLAL